MSSSAHLSGEGNGTPLQYSCLENPMDGGAWWAAVHGVAKSRRWLSDFTFTFHFHALEKKLATHSSVLAWRIPGTGEPGGLPSQGSHRVGHDWSDLAAAAACGYLFGIFSWGQQNITSGLVYCDYISDPCVHTGQIIMSVVSLSTGEERSWWDWRMREGNPDYCIAFLLFQKNFIEI